MSEVACNSVEERISSDLIGSAIDEHLLLEAAFEAILKNLLRDPAPPKSSTAPIIVSKTPSMPMPNAKTKELNVINKEAKSISELETNKKKKIIAAPVTACEPITMYNKVSPPVTTRKQSIRKAQPFAKQPATYFKKYTGSAS